MDDHLTKTIKCHMGFKVNIPMFVALSAYYGWYSFKKFKLRIFVHIDAKGINFIFKEFELFFKSLIRDISRNDKLDNTLLRNLKFESDEFQISDIVLFLNFEHNQLDSTINIYCNICESIIVRDKFISEFRYLHELFDEMNETNEFEPMSFALRCLNRKKRKRESLSTKYINIFIKNSVKTHSLIINYKNTAQSCVSLMSHLCDIDNKVQTNIHWSSTDVGFRRLLQKIGIECIVLSDYGLLDFIPVLLYDNEEAKQRIIIQKSILMLKILFNNHKVIHCMVNNSIIFSTFIMVFNVLLRSKLIRTEYCLRILVILVDTLPFWSYENVLSAIDLGFFDSLAIAMKNTYYHKNRRRGCLSFMINRILKSFAMLSIRNDGDVLQFHDYFSEFKKLYIDPILDSSKLKINKKYSKKQENFTLFINEYVDRITRFSYSSTESFKTLPFVKRIKKRYMRFCGNDICTENVNESKKKLCSQCQVIYYCSKSCQKWHWNNHHRTQCEILKSKLRNLKYQNLNAWKDVDENTDLHDEFLRKLFENTKLNKF